MYNYNYRRFVLLEVNQTVQVSTVGVLTLARAIVDWSIEEAQ